MAYFVERGVGSEDAEFPWLHPAYAELPPRLREWLDQSRHFSEIMHGAVLVYNLLLAESRTETADLAEGYRSRLGKWWHDSSLVRLFGSDGRPCSFLGSGTCRRGASHSDSHQDLRGSVVSACAGCRRRISPR